MHPYQSFSASTSGNSNCWTACFQSRLLDPAAGATEQDALRAHDELQEEIKRLLIFRNGQDYRVTQLHKEGMRCAGNVAQSNLCAQRLELARRKSLQLTRYIANAELLRDKMEDAALYGPLVSVLQHSRLSMAALVTRITPESIETLMDGLRNQGEELCDIELALAEPLAPELDLELDADDAPELVLPTVPTHETVPVQPARALLIENRL